MRGKRFSIGFAAVLAMLTATFSASETASAQETVLCSFNNTDGSGPAAGLTFDASGNLYGTTSFGGTNDSGTVYKLTPGTNGWTESVLYNFSGGGFAGTDPNTNLAIDSSGNLYGTTFFGGLFGVGTAFELSPNADGSWTETTIHSFSTNGGDGTYPHSGLVLDAFGNLYGTTPGGGSPGGYGVVFELTPVSGGWVEEILYIFDGADGFSPYGTLIFDSLGNLYGMTAFGGGSSACFNGCGTVFKLSPTIGGTWKEKLLRSFRNTDGANPYGGVIFDAAGNLYGTTSQGSAGNTGTVFELSPATSGPWKETILHNFNSKNGDGVNPSSPLVSDSHGHLYGTTQTGGAEGQGTVFGLSRGANGTWTEKVLYSFSTDDGNGYQPVPGLVIDAAGNLYGATPNGGAYSDGTVFEIEH